MDAASANPNPNPTFASLNVVSVVEKNDKSKSQVKPVDAGTESTKASLGDNELHKSLSDIKDVEDTNDFETMNKIAEEIQGRLDMLGSTLGFSINRKYETLVAEISNKNSGEVIKQIPSDEVLALRKKIEEIVGIFFDKKV